MLINIVLKYCSEDVFNDDLLKDWIIGNDVLKNFIFGGDSLLEYDLEIFGSREILVLDFVFEKKFSN